MQGEGFEIFRMIVGMLLVAVIVAIVLIVSVKVFVKEPGCNQVGDEYGLEADYRLLSKTCYVTLPDGRKINADNLRAVEPGR